MGLPKHAALNCLEHLGEIGVDAVLSICVRMS